MNFMKRLDPRRPMDPVILALQGDHSRGPRPDSEDLEDI